MGEGESGERARRKYLWWSFLTLLTVLMDGFEEVGEEVAILSWQLRKYA